MSYTVTFGTISKRENSTANSYTSVLSASCLLKESTDALAPTFSLQGQVVGDSLLPCNYMYCTEFGRYYWITSITFYHGVWYVSGEVDVLASYKSDIGNTNCYILRAASDHDDNIVDAHFAFENNPSSQITVESGTGFDAAGCVVLMCAGNDGSNSSSFYVMSTANWADLYCQIFTSNFLSSYGTFWQQITNDIRNSVLNPSDFISSAVWVPVPYVSAGSPLSPEVDIFLGVCNTGVKGKRLSPNLPLWSYTFQIDAPAHPQESTYGAWLRGNAASRDFLNLPGYGALPVDSDVLASSPLRTISGSLFVDCTGCATYILNNNGKKTLVSCNIGIPCGFTDARTDPVNAVASFLSAAGGIAEGSPSSLGDAISAVKMMFPHVSRVSAGGARLLSNILKKPELVSTFYSLPAGLSFASMGRPLCVTKTINTLSGYVLCGSDASVSCSGTKAEIDKINSYLRGGFYYE